MLIGLKNSGVKEPSWVVRWFGMVACSGDKEFNEYALHCICTLLYTRNSMLFYRHLARNGRYIHFVSLKAGGDLLYP
jgi:hypothetical protein